MGCPGARPPAPGGWPCRTPESPAELDFATTLPGPGAARFALASLALLYDALDRAWRLARSLPTAPLAAFQQQVAGLPRTTEIERWTVQRIGQDLFCQALLDYWGGHCPLTGIADPALLRASHIVLWAACRDDAQRLDVHNGLLSSALWDAAFDAGLVSFADDGIPLRAPSLSAAAEVALGFASLRLPSLLPAHGANLRDHPGAAWLHIGAGCRPICRWLRRVNFNTRE